ncbi:serine/threonine kinase family protein [Plesiocystis pacifica SIR-1]|uniref:Serine/threonine kinase family protein n=1 Tax=Plesiocystis pacifica SIR-1 TaxID=391625 RepID=A6G3C2_9BACT|nr:serine/threonine-protein kinase [Plesiocystis pacifica]EDM79529.1 serine/threonine kinase family protein [Plesiocystis pacifica SIR-1]
MNEDENDQATNLPTYPTPEPPTSSAVDELPIDLRFEVEAMLVDLDLSDCAEPFPVDESGRFEIRGLLGRGAMGAVYRAHDNELDRTVALKVVQLVAPGREHLQDRLLQEARAIARLSHPNVVHVHDIKQASTGERILALEYINGPTVRNWQRGRPLDEVLTAYLGIGRGLSEAHGGGVIHRDFKPDNALVRTADQRVVVVDFGLAGGVVDDARTARGMLSPIESSGLGTPEYMAPEQHHRPADALCDQYSFCVSLWEAVDGRRPFSGRRSSVDEVPPAPPAMPAWLYWILRRGLSWEPSDRFPNMATLVRQLERGIALRRFSRWALVVASLLLCSAGIARALQPPPCADADAVMRELWTPETRARLDSDLRGLGAPWAPRAADHVLAILDNASRRWSWEAVQLCEAELDEGRSAELDRRRGCLEQWKGHFRSSLEALSEDHASAEHLVELLAPVAAGADLCQLPPPPIDAGMTARLARIESRVVLRDFARARDEADEAVRLAHGAPPCLEGGAHSSEAAAANFELGYASTKLERWTEATDVLALASEHALGCQDWSRAFDIRLYQSYAEIHANPTQLALALARLDDARALLGPRASEGADNLDLADLERMRGIVLAAAAEPDFEASRRALARARVMLDRLEAPLYYRVRVRQNLGWVEQLARRHAQAEVAYGQALSLLDAELGPSHPESQALRALVDLNRGLMALREGAFEEAERAFTNAAARGDLVVVAKAYSSAVQTITKAGEPKAAVPLLRHHQAWLAEQIDLPDAVRAESLYTSGQALTQASLSEDGGVESEEDFEQGLGWLREAARLWSGSSPVNAQTVQLIVASSLYEAMRYDEAREALDLVSMSELPEGLANTVSELRDLIDGAE